MNKLYGQKAGGNTKEVWQEWIESNMPQELREQMESSLIDALNWRFRNALRRLRRLTNDDDVRNEIDRYTIIWEEY